MNDLNKYEERMKEWMVSEDIYEVYENVNNHYLKNKENVFEVGDTRKSRDVNSLSEMVSAVMSEYNWKWQVKDIDGEVNIVYEDLRQIEGHRKVAEMSLNGKFGHMLADYMADVIDNKFEIMFDEPLSEKCKSVLREKLLSDDKIYFDDVVKLNEKGSLFEKLRADLLYDEENETTENEFSSSYENKNKMKL